MTPADTPAAPVPAAATLYDAFISYSHAADGRLAPRLQAGLQRLARPLFRPRALHVFRDATGLSATPELWPTIQRALDGSRYLVLMASPRSAGSPWVRDEVEHWLDRSPAAREGKAAHRLLIVLSDGEIEWDAAAGRFDAARTTALPPRLHHGVFTHEPLWVDVRGAGTLEDLSLQNPYFREKVADLAATIHGRSKEELIGEDVRLARRSRRLAWSASLLLAALAIAATGFGLVARRQRNQARAGLQAALAVASVDIDPARSLRHALNAVETAQTASALSALREAAIRSTLTAELSADSGRIVTGGFSPDGASLATTVQLDTVRSYTQLWNGRTGAPVCAVASARFLRFTRDGTGAITSAGVVDPATCTRVAADTVQVPTAGSRLALEETGEDGYAISDMLTHTALVSLDAPQHGVGGMAVSPAGTLAVTWAKKGIYLESGGGAEENEETYARVWRLRAGRRTPDDTAATILPGHRRPINTAAFSHDGAVIVTGSDDRTARVWTMGSTGRWETFAVLAGHAAGVTHVAITPDGSRVLSVAGDGAARLWEPGTGTPVPIDSAAVFRLRFAARLPVLRGPDRPADFPVLTRDRRRIVAMVNVGEIAVWDAAGGERIGHSVSAHGSVETAAPDLEARLSPDGTRMLVPEGHLDQVLYEDSFTVVVDVATGAAVDTLFGHSGPVYTAAYSDDGTRIVTAGEEGTVRVWHARRDAIVPDTVLRLPDPAGFAGFGGTWLPDKRVLHVRFSPDGERVVISTRDGLVRVWTPATGQLVEMFGHDASVHRAFFSPDGALVLSQAFDGVRVWEADTGKMLRLYPEAGSRFVLLTPDCSTLAMDVIPTALLMEFNRPLTARTHVFGACGPVERMMAYARSRIRDVSPGARPARQARRAP